MEAQSDNVYEEINLKQLLQEYQKTLKDIKDVDDLQEKTDVRKRFRAKLASKVDAISQIMREKV